MKVKVYQWLKGDGKAYIDTLYSLHVGNEFKITLKDVWVNGVRQYANHENKGWGQGGTINISGGLRTRLDKDDYNNYYIYYQGASDFLAYPIKDEPYTEKITISEKNIVANVYDKNGGTIANATVKFNGIGTNTLYLYRDNHTPYVVYPGIKLISNATISENGSEVLHLVPCLTETNEACMIDLLTGELYRNQGSGAFSVEGECLYEFETPVIKQVMRKPNVVVRLREWLKSDGNSWIKIADSITLSKQTKISALVRDYVFSTDIMGAKEDTNKLFGFAFVTYARVDYGATGVLVNENVKADKFLYEVNDGIAKINDAQRTLADYNDTINSPLYLFCRQTNVYRYSGAIGEVKINTEGINLDLHPCDILCHPTLPPQSAMIDPYTGTIYTNQGSGNFTCEGEDLGIWTDTLYDDMRIKETKADMVCVMQNGEPRVVYERTQPFIEHKWLKGDGVAWIETDLDASKLNYIKTNTWNIRKSSNIGIYIGNQDYDDFGIGQYYDRNTTNYGFYARLCGREKLRLNNYVERYSFEYEERLAVYSSNVSLFYAEQESQWGSRYCNGALSEVLFGIDKNNIVLHLTPIHLTRNLFPHEIASSNTANRGECGFADKEKYKRGEPWFYGNKATSGSFSVSDE